MHCRGVPLFVAQMNPLQRVNPAWLGRCCPCSVPYPSGRPPTESAVQAWVKARQHSGVSERMASFTPPCPVLHPSGCLPSLHFWQAWVKARQGSDFSQFAPVLQEWVDLRREKARLVDPSR